MNGVSQTIAVTGAGGFVGGVIAETLQRVGHNVIALGRRPVGSYEHRAYDLKSAVPDDLLDGVDAVVHCAYDLSLTSADAIASTNVGGTRALVRAAAGARVRPILISSMSAYPGTRQIYGQAKLVSEADTLAVGGEAVRLGLVWGGSQGGMIGTLKRLSQLPVVPVFGRHPHQFTVHAEDVGAGLAKLVAHLPVGKPLGLAHPEPVPFSRIINAVAAGRRPRFVTIPWRPAYAALRLAEGAGVPLPVRADSLLGLVRPAPWVPNVDTWSKMGLRLRPFIAAETGS
jgi:nucleoside-diphosphate-sugar epimerase